jgi:hypothetical protein
MQSGLILTSGMARGDVDLAVRAEAAGFDSVFTIEFFNRHGYAPLGAIAQATAGNECRPETSATQARRSYREDNGFERGGEPSRGGCALRRVSLGLKECRRWTEAGLKDDSMGRGEVAWRGLPLGEGGSQKR